MYKDKTEQFEAEYANIFDFYVHENIRYAKYKADKTAKDLREHFRVLQTFDTVIAMTSDKYKKVLGIKKIDRI